jgi:hypothetical protein
VSFKFISNLNVFIAALTGASYLLGWLQEVALILLAAILVALWAIWGLTPTRGVTHQRLYLAGQLGVAISVATFAGGVALSLHAASIGIEDEYWCWVLMLDMIGPVGAICFIASMGLMFSALVKRPNRSTVCE